MSESGYKTDYKFLKILSTSISLDSGGCRGPEDFLGMRVCAKDSTELVHQYNILVCKNRLSCVLDPRSSPDQLRETMPRYAQR